MQISFANEAYIGSIHFEVKISLKGYVHDFSVDYNATDKSHLLNICDHLMVKNNIK